MPLPTPRGRISAGVVAALRSDPTDPSTASLETAGRLRHDVIGDGDVQLALWMMYELSYRGFADADDRW